MTPQWNSLLDGRSLAKLLPPDQAHFVRPVREAMLFFLQGLSEEKQIELYRAQVALPLGTPIAQRLGVLSKLSPVLQKLGQLLARVALGQFLGQLDFLVQARSLGQYPPVDVG